MAEGGIADECTGTSQFRNGDDGKDGRVLDGGDELVDQRKKTDLSSLWCNDAPQFLSLGHAQSLGGFPLAWIDGMDAGADDFCDIGTGVEGKTDDAGRSRPHRDAERWETKVNQVQLDHQRSSSEDPDVEPDDGRESLQLGIPTEGQKDSQKQSQEQ